MVTLEQRLALAENSLQHYELMGCEELTLLRIRREIARLEAAIRKRDE